MRDYGEPVEVRRHDTTPEQFIWRGRLYLVRGVLAHWVDAGGWWRRPAVEIDDAERECWRVEAGTGPGEETGVYDLCFDEGGEGWTLARVVD